MLTGEERADEVMLIAAARRNTVGLPFRAVREGCVEAET